MNLFRSVAAALTLVALEPFASTMAQAADQAPTAAKTWSDQIWAAASDNDGGALDRFFNTLPADLDQNGADRFRQSFALHEANLEKAKVKQQESRDKALTELHDHAAKGDLSKALRSAVTVQTLSENLNSALDNPDIQQIVKWAQERIPQVEADLDWLLAQELLFYLQTLYEDTDRVEEYRSYHDQLDAVNRRVSLLSQYAPHRLHDLRVLRAERLGDPKPPPYRPTKSPDGVTKSGGITEDMLKQSLRTAANDHIESSGWKPLIRGGLEELRLLATTASLEETFPKLSDANAVQQWVAYLDKELASIEETKFLDRSALTRILNELVKLNETTIQLGRDQQTGEVNRGVLYREFGDGALYELDEFSEIIWPDKLPRFRQATEGAFVGVGILIRHNDTQDIVVVNPLEGTPAYFGGVKPNDKIAEVDGESTVGWQLTDAVDRITGAPATKVTLGLQREGVEGVVNITLQRDVIKLRSVMGWWKKNLAPDGEPQWDWHVDPDSRIAYVKLTQFTEDTYSDLLDAWREISAKGKPAGLILDLRFNPGGLLTSAVQISNLFVRDGLIVSAEDKKGVKAWPDQKADPTKARFEGVPTVVLINNGSASASEIVSGCLQAHRAAIILGERTYGKGSVQTVHQTAINARLKLTTQYYRLPPTPEEMAHNEPGRIVHKRIGETRWGVDPDIQVKMTPQQVSDSLELRQKADVIPQGANGALLPDSPDRPNVNQLLTGGIDPQLSKALLLLQARALGETSGQTQHARTNEKTEVVTP